MAEMNRVARFFVNRSAARRAARAYDWIRREVPVPHAARCLEIGCGHGDLAVRIVEGFRPAQYVATDLDSLQVETARRAVAKRYPSGLPPALILRTADMLHLPFDDASFDVVFAVVALHHAGRSHHDPTGIPGALSEIDRVLRPGGLVVYQEFLHKELIRKWFTGHGFSIDQVRRRRRHESVVVSKSGTSSVPVPSPEGLPGP